MKTMNIRFRPDDVLISEIDTNPENCLKVVRNSSNQTVMSHFIGGYPEGNTILEEDGKVYMGSIQNGAFIGNLLYLDNLGGSYIGESLNLEMHGFGCYQASKIQKIGTRNRAQLEGFSVVSDSKKGTLDCGWYLDGVLDGCGVQLSESSSFIGEFKAGKRQGIGLNANSYTEYYLGVWNQGMREDFGVWAMGSGDRFEGNFKNNKKNGIGRFVHLSEKAIYIGEFKDGKRHGFGKLESDRLQYTGQWIQNKREGLGYQSVTGMATYFGYFLDDKKNGVGIERRSDFEYRGSFSRGKMDGFGYLYKTGAYEVVQFREGSFVRIVSETKCEGLRSELEQLDLNSYINNANLLLAKIDNQVIKARKTLVKSAEESTSLGRDFGPELTMIKGSLISATKTLKIILRTINDYFKRVEVICLEQKIPLNQIFSRVSCIKNHANRDHVLSQNFDLYNYKIPASEILQIISGQDKEGLDEGWRFENQAIDFARKQQLKEKRSRNSEEGFMKQIEQEQKQIERLNGEISKLQRQRKVAVSLSNKKDRVEMQEDEKMKLRHQISSSKVELERNHENLRNLQMEGNKLEEELRKTTQKLDERENFLKSLQKTYNKVKSASFRTKALPELDKKIDLQTQDLEKARDNLQSLNQQTQLISL